MRDRERTERMLYKEKYIYIYIYFTNIIDKKNIGSVFLTIYTKAPHC